MRLLTQKQNKDIVCFSNLYLCLSLRFLFRHSSQFLHITSVLPPVYFYLLKSTAKKKEKQQKENGKGKNEKGQLRTSQSWLDPKQSLARAASFRAHWIQLNMTIRCAARLKCSGCSRPSKRTLWGAQPTLQSSISLMGIQHPQEKELVQNKVLTGSTVGRLESLLLFLLGPGTFVEWWPSSKSPPLTLLDGEVALRLLEPMESNFFYNEEKCS